MLELSTENRFFKKPISLFRTLLNGKIIIKDNKISFYGKELVFLRVSHYNCLHGQSYNRFDMFTEHFFSTISVFLWVSMCLFNVHVYLQEISVKRYLHYKTRVFIAKLFLKNFPEVMKK